MYRLLGLDLDGTLLNEKHEISEKNKEYINLLKEKGTKVILLSGRETGSVKFFSEELSLMEPLVGFNGGIITDYTGKEIFYEECIEEKWARKVVAYGEINNMCIFIFMRSHIFVSDKEDTRFKIFERYTTDHVDEVGNISKYLEDNRLWANINKILIADENENLVKYKEKLENILSDNLSMQFSLPFFLEIFSPNISKGNALDKLGRIFNIKREEMVAIGDGENDISMIEYAGLGVAMENALENVKDKADYITLSNKEDGVSHVIKKFWKL